MERVHRRQLKPFLTKDTAEIRDFFANRHSGIKNQSFAEARVKPGKSTLRHYHKKSEEIYYITKGKGRMELGGKKFDVRTGDAIAILPGTEHRITNTGREELVLFCCCAPAYTHSDTIILN